MSEGADGRKGEQYTPAQASSCQSSPVPTADRQLSPTPRPRLANAPTSPGLLPILVEMCQPAFKHMQHTCPCLRATPQPRLTHKHACAHWWAPFTSRLLANTQMCVRPCHTPPRPRHASWRHETDQEVRLGAPLRAAFLFSKRPGTAEGMFWTDPAPPPLAQHTPSRPTDLVWFLCPVLTWSDSQVGFQMTNPRLREVRPLSRGHAGRKRWCWESRP